MMTNSKEITGHDAGKLRVFLADDHQMLLDGLILVLGHATDIEIVGSSGEGNDVLSQVRQLRPDVLVLDITMPGLNGIEVCRELRGDIPKPKILMLSVHNDEQFIAQSIGAGASGYLLKEAASEELVNAIRQVSRGHFYLSDGISTDVMGRVVGATVDLYKSLSSREREVLRFVAEGNSNLEIGKQLGISAKTIDTHKRRLMKKLDLNNPMDLLKFAIRNHIVQI